MDGDWKFQGGSQKPQFLKEHMKLNWISRGVEGSNQKNHSWGRYGYFLEQDIFFLKLYKRLTFSLCYVP